MTMQSATLHVVTHDLTPIYGAYVITEGDTPMFVGTDIELVFEMFDRLTYDQAAKIRVYLVSGEEMTTPFDCTALVWDAFVHHLAGCDPETHEDFQKHVSAYYGFVAFGFDEGYREAVVKMQRKAGL